MAWDTATHKRLRDICVYLWPDSRDCRKLVADSLIDASKINWDEPPNLRWQSVIMEAEKQNTLHKLVPVLLREYPGNLELQKACAPWLEEKGTITKSKEKAAQRIGIDLSEEIPVTLESIRQDLAILSREFAEMRRWRKELSTMSAQSNDATEQPPR